VLFTASRQFDTAIGEKYAVPSRAFTWL